jgi:hypothetical protein
MNVKVTLGIRGQAVPADQVKDKTVAAALKKMGQDIGRQLDGIKCPEHSKGATDVRIHVGASGNGDLKYEVCCMKLTDAIKRVLG